MQFKFLLVDIETSGVLCSAESITAANTLAQGIFNVRVSIIPMYMFRTRPQWQDLNFDTNYLSYDDTNGPSISTLSQQLITEEFSRKRLLAITRRKFLIRLEGFLSIVLYKTSFGFESSTMSYVENQLIQCDLENKVYADSIKEYAQYNNIAEDRAYDELFMLAESQGRMKLRLFACYNKYSKKLNETDSESNMESIYNDAMKDIFINARL